ncbi:hypothetical protein [Erythrobacter sp. SG61-1L]|uniref:hypothetical protein n=1 Tax=Erythrobacter sp. SG61-1L TaxID=1603897 RepID=UPI0012E13FEF|nr:hypothetical protein [Erythrobacter sp. SG61-1L]
MRVAISDHPPLSLGGSVPIVAVLAVQLVKETSQFSDHRCVAVEVLIEPPYLAAVAKGHCKIGHGTAFGCAQQTAEATTLHIERLTRSTLQKAHKRGDITPQSVKLRDVGGDVRPPIEGFLIAFSSLSISASAIAPSHSA